MSMPKLLFGLCVYVCVCVCPKKKREKGEEGALGYTVPYVSIQRSDPPSLGGERRKERIYDIPSHM